MKTPSLLLLGAALSLTATSCADQPDVAPQPAPAPAATFTLARSFYYPGTTVFSGVSYPTADVRAHGHQNPAGLHLQFVTHDRREGVYLTVDRSALGPDLLGTYALRSATNSRNPALAGYGYNYRVTDGGTAGSYYASSFSELEGQVRISAYDAARHLISGSYEVRLPDVSDPTDSVRARANQLRCRVTLGGSFANLRVE
ncbi:hypothetical protein [Hymenobacter edaphi]|uniref:Lipoprotein n=1 Tax=Hymenobacter edaphi TaxID=2211146 RepID=A0A328BPF8_9BACT|nr:hypothetical protein [Hymenobacter edaphi]RAK68361.1 hypothetical protein DLM85_10090 [Hymenobacter edaphi]